MFKKLLLTLSVFAVIFCGVLFSQSQFSTVKRSEASAKLVNTNAPVFSMTNAKTGAAYSLTDFSGKPIFLNFWATWCPPCVMEMPHINDLYAEYGDKMNFVVVSVDDQKEAPANFAANRGLNFPVYYGDKAAIFKDYGLMGIPTSYIIGADGKIRAEHVGGMSKEDMKAFLDLAF